MVDTYDGRLGLTVNVYPVGSEVRVGFDSTIVLIGDIDSGSASNAVTAHTEVVSLPDKSTVEDKFGTDSDFLHAWKAANGNGAGDIYGVGIDTASPDYSTAAQTAMSIDPRYVYVDTDTDSDVTSVLTEVNNKATGLTFGRVFAPISSSVTAGSAGSYSTRDSDNRLVEVAPRDATYDGDSTFTAAAVVGKAARKPLGYSLASDTITVDSFGTDYSPQEADDFDGVTAVTEDAKIVDGVTTSDEEAFADIFQMEIVDTAILGLEEVADDFNGDAVNTLERRRDLESQMRIYLESLTQRNPPLLADFDGDQPYRVTVTAGDSASTGEAAVGIKPVEVMKEVTIDLNVGSITTLENLDA